MDKPEDKGPADEAPKDADAGAESPVGTGPADEGPKDEDAPKDKPDGPADKGTADDPAARIAELQRQLDEAAPVLKAHKDAEDARKSELQKERERAEALETELSALRDEAARARVAEKTGLTSVQVAALKGSTEDELMKAAEVFAAKRTLRTKSTPTVGNGPSSGGDEPDADSPSKMAERIRKLMPY